MTVRHCDFEDRDCQGPVQLVPGLVRRFVPGCEPGTHACRFHTNKLRDLKNALMGAP